MSYKRIFVRVPIDGNATLSNGNRIGIQAQAIDISQGGIAVSSVKKDLPEGDYDIVVNVKDFKKIEFVARLIRQNEGVLAFKTSSINNENLRMIEELVFRYQETEDFIEQMLEHNLLDHWFEDDDGNEIEVAFHSDCDKE